MDLRSLNTFIQVAESGSFTRAAEKLGYSQPTISVQIKQLEQELGTRLFDRIGHTVRLTEGGHQALLHAQKICHMCREMAAETGMEKDTRGTIRVAMADSLCSRLVNSGFGRFQAAYPHISLKVMTAGTDELFDLLDHNEADIVCTLDSHIYDTSYVVASEEKVGVHFVAGESSPLAARRTIEIEQLLEQPFMLTEKGMSYRRLMDEMLAQNGLEIRPVLEMSHTDLICQLVEKGMGLSFLPDYVTQDGVDRGSVVRLQVPGFEPELWKQLLYHRDKWVSPQMQAVLDHMARIQIGERC